VGKGRSLFSVSGGVLLFNNAFGERLKRAKKIKSYKIARGFYRFQRR